jgi:hypothetical protein
MLFVMQEWDEYFMKLLGGRKEKGKAETEMKKKADGVRGNRNYIRRSREANKE